MEKTIKEIRGKFGLTQKKLSTLLNIPLRTIENWEMGSRKPKDWILDLIYFKLYIDYNYDYDVIKASYIKFYNEGYTVNPWELEV